MFASDSLSSAQKGVLLASSIKILIPFLFTLPGIIGYELFKDQISNADRIFPVILGQIIPAGIKGFILIAFFSTILGATNALLHACSTMLSFDIYKRFINQDASEKKLILVSRIGVVVFVVTACLLAPNLQNFEHLFQNSQYISSALAPVLAAIFLFGLYSSRTSGKVALIALFVATPVYLVLLNTTELSTLSLAGINFILTSLVLLILTLIKPLPQPFVPEEKKSIRFERNLGVFIWFVFIVTFVIAVYVIFT
jgi:SSS family solute:Na+ symporter